MRRASAASRSGDDEHRRDRRALDLGLGHQRRAARGARALGRSRRPARRRCRADHRQRCVRAVERHRARARGARARGRGSVRSARDRRAVSSPRRRSATSATAAATSRRLLRGLQLRLRELARLEPTASLWAARATRATFRPRACAVGRGQRHGRQRRAVRLPRAVRGRSRRAAGRGRDGLARRRSRRVHVRRGRQLAARARVAARRARRRGAAARSSRSRCGAARCASGRSWRPRNACAARSPSRSSAPAASRCASAAARRCVAAALRALHEAASRRIVGYERLPAAERVAAVARLAGVDAAELAAAHGISQDQRSLELRGKLALLESARRQLVSGSQWSKHGKRI